MNYSIVVPVFNRPDEVKELLDSLCSQTLKDFEVIIVEDGSSRTCKDVCDQYANILDLHYYDKKNSGPGQSRNYGVERANGTYVIVLDSDVVLPARYLESVDKNLFVEKDGQKVETTVAWGGPDKAHPSFTPIQKAISYSMTSFFTTGGIRGGKAKLDKFYPRSFNMGIRRDVYMQLGGFSKMRFGEDIDFSYRIVEAGYKPRLFADAWVWHKRRTDFSKFYRQVYNSGIARINLEKRHPGTLKLVHLLPAIFAVGSIACVLMAFLGSILWYNGEWMGTEEGKPINYIFENVGRAMTFTGLIPLLCYSAIIFLDSSIRNLNLWVGLLSVPAAFTQLVGYGLGFLEAWWKRCVKGMDEFTAFDNNFYK